MKNVSKKIALKNVVFALALLAVIQACNNDDEDNNPPQPTTVASTKSFNKAMSGSREVPAVVSTGTGNFTGTFNSTTKIISYTVTWTLGVPTDSVVGMHFHGPADTTQSAGILIGVTGFPKTSTGSYSAQTPALTSQQEADLLAGRMYFNVHSGTYPDGELRGNLK